MNLVQFYGLFCLVADLQQLPQAVDDKRKVGAVKMLDIIFVALISTLLFALYHRFYFRCFF